MRLIVTVRALTGGCCVNWGLLCKPRAALSWGAAMQWGLLCPGAFKGKNNPSEDNFRVKGCHPVSSHKGTLLCIWLQAAIWATV